MAIHFEARSTNDTDRRLGERLRQLRIEAGMTLQDLGAKIGLSYQQVQKYEKGENRMSAGLILTLSDLFGVSVCSIFRDPGGGCCGRSPEVCEAINRLCGLDDPVLARRMLNLLNDLAPVTH